ncbi:heme ABC transporter ATP-binding protein [Sphingobacterium hungaricum]
MKNVDFEAHAGELLAIIGPNGAGKSTLLKILCKEFKSSSGEVLIKNKDLNSYSLKELAKFRAVLAQSNLLSINFTIEELIMMGRYPHFKDNPSENDLKIVNQVIDDMGIEHLKNRSYFTLSGGEQQRVQLARILAQIYDGKESILFLDEPINGLDLLYQQLILEQAKKLAKMGFCVVCILHDINFASKYADKILILKDGEKIGYGTPKETITVENIRNTYNTTVKLIEDSDVDYPFIVPISTT